MGGYLPSTPVERADMLAAIGVSSVDELYAAVPDKARVAALDLSEGKSELEIREIFTNLASKNTVFRSVFRGAGAYRRHIPAIVNSVIAKEELSTAYTPYQAEVSQGVLQSIFEYQTMVCELFGMDAANASVYDGATAATEAVFMCVSRARNSVVVSDAVHPHVRETLRTYCSSRDIEVIEVASQNGKTDPAAIAAAASNSAACVLVQQPNFFGVLEDVSALVEAAHGAGAKAIVSCEPVSLGILAAPGDLGADICVAEGQSLGLPLSFGGPYLGMMACKKPLMRKLPGRIVGETCDDDGNRAFVLTLQAREQHIRREKAASNICSNEALCALAASVYLSAMGPHGLAQAAKLSYSKAHYLAERLCSIDGFEPMFDSPFFNEVALTCPIGPHELEARLVDRGVLSGLPIEGGMLWCATEMNSKDQIDALEALIREVI